MIGLLAVLAMGAVAPNYPQVADFVPVSTVSGSMYVVQGSILRTENSTLVTVIMPLQEMGLMSMRLEMDCTARRYRPLIVSFYNQDGSPRRSTGAGEGDGPAPGWATRDAVEIAGIVCR